MYGQSRPALRTPALDYLLVVDTRQRDPSGVTPFAVPLEASEQRTLDRIVAECAQDGPSASLEMRARSFLVTYRERADRAGALTNDEERRLNGILNDASGRQRPHATWRMPRPLWLTRARVITAAAAVVIVIAAVIIAVVGIEGNTHQGEPTPGTAQQNPPAQQIAPGTTDLQNLQKEWGPWQQLTPSDQSPQTGQPALLLLQTGGYFVSMSWTIPANSSGWQQDIGGNVSNVDVHGNYADITDADDNPYIVGINQPFIVSSNPDVVIKIDPTGNVWTMSLSQATALRLHLSK